MMVNIEHAKAALIDSRVEFDKVIDHLFGREFSLLELKGCLRVLQRSHRGIADYFESVLNAIAAERSATE